MYLSLVTGTSLLSVKLATTVNVYSPLVDSSALTFRLLRETLSGAPGEEGKRREEAIKLERPCTLRPTTLCLTSHISGEIQVTAKCISSTGTTDVICSVGTTSVSDGHHDGGGIGHVWLEARYIGICCHGEVERFGTTLVDNCTSEAPICPIMYLSE